MNDNETNENIINISATTKDRAEACKEYIESIFYVMRKILSINNFRTTEV